MEKKKNSPLTKKGGKGVIWKAASFNFKKKDLTFANKGSSNVILSEIK